MTRATIFAFVVLALGCPGREPTSVPPEPPVVTPPASRCGDAKTSFADAAPLPADAALVALIDPHEDALGDALAKLEQHVRGGGSGLAVPTVFALAQWRWEVPIVSTSLSTIGIDTATLAAVSIDALRLWVVPLGCDFDQLVHQLGTHFDVRDLGEAAIATPRDRTKFAHDIVVRADAIVLCPPGMARRVLAAWARPAAISGPPSLRQTAFELAPAALRIAIRETGLLGAAAGDSATADHSIRVDANGVDATLAP